MSLSLRPEFFYSCRAILHFEVLSASNCLAPSYSCWYNSVMYTEISANKWKSVGLLLVFLLFVIGLGWLLAYVYDNPSILVIAVVIAVASAVIALCLLYRASLESGRILPFCSRRRGGRQMKTCRPRQGRGMRSSANDGSSTRSGRRRRAADVERPSGQGAVVEARRLV